MKTLNIRNIELEKSNRCIYEIVNTKNKRKYIGLTSNFKSRILAHYTDIVKSKHSCIIPTEYEKEIFLENLQYSILINTEQIQDKNLIKVLETFCMMRENINVYNSNVNANIPKIYKPLLYTLLLNYGSIEEAYKHVLKI